MRFREKEKLSPQFLGPFEILRSVRVRVMAYQVAFPLFIFISNIFYVSMLRSMKLTTLKLCTTIGWICEKTRLSRASGANLEGANIGLEEHFYVNVNSSAQILCQYHDSDKRRWNLKKKCDTNIPSLFEN